MASPANNSDQKKTRRPPATTPEARENQMVASAMDLAERQIRDGTASAQVITHYLKIGSVRESLERAKLAQENELLKAKVQNMESAKNVEELYSKAIDAMRRYSGRDLEDDHEE